MEFLKCQKCGRSNVTLKAVRKTALKDATKVNKHNKKGELLGYICSNCK